MLVMLIGLFFGLMIFLGVPLFGSIVCAVVLLPLVFSSCPYGVAEIADWAVSGANYSAGIPIVVFIISGALMSKGKLTQKIFDIFDYFLGDKTGFMPIISIMTAMFYSAISGSATAVAAAVGGMCYPILIEMGYEPAFCAVILMCAGVLGFLIPPSTPLTSGAGFVSLDLLTVYKGGAVLGIAIGVVLILYSYIYCRRHGNGDPEIIHNHHMKVRSRGFVAVFKDGIWALLCPVLILGLIFSGLTTVAQTAVISVIYAIIICVFVYKTLDFSGCIETIQNAIRDSLPMLVMLMCALILSSCMKALDAPTMIANAIANMGIGVTAVIALILLAMTLLGAFMDSGAAMAMLVPVVVPVAAAMGANPYALLVAVVAVQSMGLITPPFGLVLFMFLSLTKQPLGKLVKQLIVPFVLFMAMACLFCMVPGLTSWLF
ncbi:MAG: TRAP transporter large permease subunit [Lachnospiraceae bacterium]|nr:TRAP transporter large permease subunit [Lachnospiraceae bacterium]